VPRAARVGPGPRRARRAHRPAASAAVAVRRRDLLASLALALGLGEVVTARAGGIRLDTLFVDEGFGSLDPETLELALRTLDDLRAAGVPSVSSATSRR
jgi:hypothetical protein